MEPMLALQNIQLEAEHVFWVVKVLLTLGGALLLLRILKGVVGKFSQWVFNRNALTPEQEKRTRTLVALFNNVLTVGVLLITGMLLLSEVGFNIGPLLAGAGVVGVAVAFGSQSLVKDLFYGLIILLENQFGIGDIIQVGDNAGVVEQMTFRMVALRDLDGRLHIVPNGEITRVIVASRGWARANINIPVGYQADLDEVFQILTATGEKLFEEWPDALMEPPTVLGVEELTLSDIKIKLIAKTYPSKQWDVMRELRKRIVQALMAANIDVPGGAKQNNVITLTEAVKEA